MLRALEGIAIFTFGNLQGVNLSTVIVSYFCAPISAETAQLANEQVHSATSSDRRHFIMFQVWPRSSRLSIKESFSMYCLMPCTLQCGLVNRQEYSETTRSPVHSS